MVLLKVNTTQMAAHSLGLALIIVLLLIVQTANQSLGYEQIQQQQQLQQQTNQPSNQNDISGQQTSGGQVDKQSMGLLTPQPPPRLPKINIYQSKTEIRKLLGESLDFINSHPRQI